MTYLVDGKSLTVAGRYVLDYASGLPASPQRRVTRLDRPRRSGVIVRKESGWNPGSLSLVVTIFDRADVPFVQALLARAGQITFEGRTAHVIEVGLSEPERVSIDAWRLSADFELQPFWRESSTLTSAALAPGAAVLFGDWEGSTGDIMDGVLRFKGPFTKLLVAHGGLDAHFDTARTASQYLFFSPTEFVAWTGSASAWNIPSSMSSRVVVEYGAAGPLTALSPVAGGVEVSVTGEGFVLSGTTAEKTAVSMRGGRYWL